MRARQRQLIQTLFGEEHTKIQNIVDEDGSDSAIVDNALEFYRWQWNLKKSDVAYS